MFFFGPRSQATSFCNRQPGLGRSPASPNSPSERGKRFPHACVIQSLNPKASERMSERVEREGVHEGSRNNDASSPEEAKDSSKEEDDLRRRNIKKMSEQSETAGGKDKRESNDEDMPDVTQNEKDKERNKNSRNRQWLTEPRYPTRQSLWNKRKRPSHRILMHR